MEKYEDLWFEVKYYEDEERINIASYCYKSIDYYDIKTKEDILKAIKDFLKNELEED